MSCLERDMERGIEDDAAGVVNDGAFAGIESEDGHRRVLAVLMHLSATQSR